MGLDFQPAMALFFLEDLAADLLAVLIGGIQVSGVRPAGVRCDGGGGR